MLALNEELLQRKNWFDLQVEDYLSAKSWPSSQSLISLKKSFAYSFSQGGKRFRPVISLLIGEAFGVPPQKILPWALAIEMIHTYSLIHDDLPCMDNDDFRRGEPTNHKVFGEDIALLAGDLLQTEAFALVAEKFQSEPTTAVQLVKVLAEAIGSQGMVSGQAIDMGFKDQKMQESELLLMHSLKTGALIRASVEGAAIVCGIPVHKRQLCRAYGEDLGLAFQLKDDLLDSEEGKVQNLDFQHKLEQVSKKAKANLESLGISEGPLVEMIDYNLQRTQ